MPNERTGHSAMTRRVVILTTIYLIAALMLFFIYRVGYQSVLQEIRYHAMGVAAALAASIDPDDLEMIHGPEDMDRPEYQRIAYYLDQVILTSPDVHYAYTMRRGIDPDAPAHLYYYIVDGPDRDMDGDGIISIDEQAELPGEPYDITDYPAMLEAWERPAADAAITPDPPYPDMISGYAPIQNEYGETVAIVGVDILAETVAQKVFYLRLTCLVIWLTLCVLGTLAVVLFEHKSRALEQVQALSQDLQKSNRILQETNERLETHNRRYERELLLARKVQQGFLPEVFPFTNKIQFGRLYLSCEILGGDLYDAFRLDDHRVGIYMADVSGHGVSAALVSGLLKMSIETLRSRAHTQGEAGSPELFHPKALIEFLNRTMRDSIPRSEFITFCYGVFDFQTNQLTLANAGHLPPIHYRASDQTARYWDMGGSYPFGIMPDLECEEESRSYHPGDKLIFYTDGITEAHLDNEEVFGEERLLNLVEQEGVLHPDMLIQSIKEKVDRHLGGKHLKDDFSILVAHIL